MVSGEPTERHACCVLDAQTTYLPSDPTSSQAAFAVPGTPTTGVNLKTFRPPPPFLVRHSVLFSKQRRGTMHNFFFLALCSLLTFSLLPPISSQLLGTLFPHTRTHLVMLVNSTHLVFCPRCGVRLTFSLLASSHRLCWIFSLRRGLKLPVQKRRAFIVVPHRPLRTGGEHLLQIPGFRCMCFYAHTVPFIPSLLK